jgi:cobalamin synthase
MLSLLVCAIAAIVLVIDLVSLLPTLWQENVRSDTNHVLQEVAQNRPNIFLIWVAALLLAWLGFVGARLRPWLAAPVLALVIIWSHELTGGFPGRHPEIIGTATERSYMMQVWLACAIALIATGQGMRSWGVRYNKRAERTGPGV